MYEAMARRYRPHTFDDVIGQEHVAQTLKNSIAAGRVAHAYLFCGPHGCGKTSMARIFACALVCEQGPSSTPCGKCAICQDVLRGQDIDVQEIDGASNNGVEQVRALREQVGYVPSRARYKIYIIDEVHMLSVAAFNALLKTLEEPPAHVKFILATTDPHKILGTILSRCQRFDFRLVPPEKMAAYLQRLVTREQAEITEDALAAIAAFSGGSMRDGLVLLDQLVSFSSGKVTREDVERVRGVAGAESVAGIFEAIVSHKLKDALSIVDAVSSRGTNAGDFLDQLIAFGRDLMYMVATGSDEGISAYGPARATLLELSTALTLEQILLMLDMFAQARTRIRTKALSNSLVPLEMAVARLAGIELLTPVSDIVEKLSAYASGAPLPEPVEMPAGQRQEAVATAELNSGRKPAESPVVSQPEKQDMVAEVLQPAAENVLGVSPGFKDDLSVQEEPGTEMVASYVSEDEDSGENDGSDLPWREETISTGPLSAEAVVKVPPEVGIETDSVENAVGSEVGAEGAPIAAGADSAEATAAFSSPEKSGSVSPVSVVSEGKGANSDINLTELWQKILAALQQRSRADSPFLGDVYVEKYTPGELYLSVPGGGTFIYEQLEDKHRKQRLAESAGEVLGGSVNIHLVLREAITPGQEGVAGLEPQEFVSPAQMMFNAGRERGVKVILDNFEGNIINIEDA